MYKIQIMCLVEFEIFFLLSASYSLNYLFTNMLSPSGSGPLLVLK
jgi:hypothetical protein